jgi:hypothetical protein
VVLAAAVIASLIIGFLAGLLSFRKSEQFCPNHGITKTCPLCNKQTANAGQFS